MRRKGNNRAVQIAPDDFDAQLGLGALLLKHPERESLLAATSHIGIARAILDKIPADQFTNDQIIDCQLISGICLALNDQADSAREVFNQVIAHDPDNQKVKDALAALSH